MPDWENIVRELGPKLLRYFSASFPRHASSDLVQESLIRLVRKSENGDFDPTRGTYRALAFGIAHYVRLEHLKAMDPQVPLNHSFNDPPSPLSLENEYSRSEEGKKLRTAIYSLRSPEQDILLLLIDKDLTLKEIGLILDLPEGTVKSHVFRAKENLKTILQGEKDGSRPRA